MALDNPALNATLVTAGVTQDLESAALGTVSGTAGVADHTVIDNAAGNSMAGDYTIENFGKNDSILSTKKIFDGNNDGIIAFGPNAVLDTERFGGGTKTGDTQVNVIGEGGDPVLAIRYLGTKDGYYVYADASVRLAGFTELTVADNTFDVSAGDVNLFYDNALGLNLGGDTIIGFGAGDKITTTSALFDSDVNLVVNFGKNEVLDLSGANGPNDNDPADTNYNTAQPGDHPGGQIDFGGSIDGLAFLGSYIVNGVTYYEYGAA